MKANPVIKVNPHRDSAFKAVPRVMQPQEGGEVEINYPDARTAQREEHYLNGRRSMMRGDLMGICFDVCVVSSPSRAEREDRANQGQAAA